MSRRGRRHSSKSDNRYRHVSQVMLPVTRDSLSEIDEYASTQQFSYPSSVWSEGFPPINPHGLPVYELLQRTAATTVYDNDPYDTYDFLLRHSRLDQYTPHALEPIHEVGHGEMMGHPNKHVLRRQQGSRTLRQDVKNTHSRPDVRSVIQSNVKPFRPDKRGSSSRSEAKSSTHSDRRSSTRSPQKPSSRSNARTSPYYDGLPSRTSETRSSARTESNLRPSSHSRPHTLRRRERQATRAKLPAM